MTGLLDPTRCCGVLAACHDDDEACACVGWGRAFAAVGVPVR